jgi:tellurite resistance protein
VVLDARLKQLAKGMSARDAADAFATYQTDPHSLRDSERAQAAEFEATIEAMFLMAAVDGEITPAEMGQLTASVEAIMDLAGKRVDTNKLLAELNTRLGKEGWKARLDAVATHVKSPEARSFAFRLAAGVAFVDNHVAHAEAAGIAALAGALDLTPEESQEILNDVQETLFG